MAETKKNLYIEDGVLKNLEQDIFGHKHIADAIVESILRTQPPFTIGIFGGWGAGKSSLLDIIENKLKKNDIVVAKIDAWRYSSSDNLSRAFLVHIANELKPTLLDELHEELFYSKQKTSLLQSSKLNLSKKTWWEKTLEWLWSAFRFLLKFFGLFAILFFFMFIIFSVLIIFQNWGFNNFWQTFDLVDFRDKLFNLAFIPLILAIIDDVRLNFVQQPVTINRERIDADELFSQLFDKVVEEKTKGAFSKKFLVIFVDNLDRLSNEKMVEALEGLKTYLNNPKCIFVVACDDNVVRSVVNDRVDSERRQIIKAGEHYLDKFFQQTFRLPEYMSVNLHDFAMQNFETTILYDKLVQKKEDIGYLVSIILPSHVNSPRKVKRLINEFIALYEIVEKRESDKDAQLRLGQLTNNVEALGKFSTLRAEYPEFYQLLIKDTDLLQRITEWLQQSPTETGENPVHLIDIPNRELLYSYIRKTELISIEDIDAYIWLSQDGLSLGLPSNLFNQLRSALVTNDPPLFKKTLDESTSDSQKTVMVKVAYRIANSSAGIDQQNGAKVLAYLLPQFDNSIQVATANVIEALMTRRLNVFTAKEIFNVLRWARRGGIESQRQKLINEILNRLKNQELRLKTFEAILENADVVKINNAEDSVQRWLSEILTVENQIASTSIDATTGKNVIQPSANQEFAEWMVSEIVNYSDNNDIVDTYFSNDLVDYLVLRTLGEPLNLQSVYLGGDDFGGNADKVFGVVGKRVREGVINTRYWQSLLSLIEKAEFVEDVEYSVNAVTESVNVIPDEMVEKFVFGMFSALERLSKMLGEDKIEDEALVKLLHQITSLVTSFRHKVQAFENSRLEDLPTKLSELFANPALQDNVFEFVDKFSQEFGKDNAGIFISSLVMTLSKSDTEPELDKIINKVLDLNDVASDENRSEVIAKVDSLISSNSQDKIDFAYKFVERMTSLKEYFEQLTTLSQSWLEKLVHGEINAFRSKARVLELLIDNKFLSADAYVDHVIKILPLAGEQAQLEIVFDEIRKIDKAISVENGKALFNVVSANATLLNAQYPKSIEIAAFWRDDADEAERSAFDTNVISLYKNSPNIYLPIHLVSWKDLTVDQIRDDLITVHLREVSEDLIGHRDLATRNAIEMIDIDQRKEVVLFIWNRLINDRDASEIFIRVAKPLLPLEIINDIRQESINSIKENINPEINFRLLASTIRDDTRNMMPVVELFVDYLGRDSSEDIQLALKYIVDCLKPFGLRDDHKGKLAQAMKKMPIQNSEDLAVIKQKASELELKWFKHDTEKSWWESSN